ncbi:hypothetical protein P0O24_08905 [Methanotrichaceae archaeon M04Ac]|uniref:Uncharacterized protein n=1 Tax=Candidatus Methanocrinis alkalitolerans TaxID=3033395 RepID=A0ABT5XG48_9EURY|nr:hypothetical protein [Candidatus Methanocrinis alkalitolerans]MDF0593701.1 hypothetical protein [Candidatus Methanocrinis alkalitolerans]
MKKILLLTALFSTLAFFLAGTSLAQETGREMLIQDSGNETIVNVDTYRIPGYLKVAEAVKFTPPRQSWTLEAVHILSLVPYEENDTLPDDQIISMEIRDENLNLLYRFTDSHLPYFTNQGDPIVGVIEVPSLPISGDFYVCFYDRGAVAVGVDFDEVEGNSYYYNMQTGELFLAEIAINETEEFVPVNWIIRALGH